MIPWFEASVFPQAIWGQSLPFLIFSSHQCLQGNQLGKSSRPVQNSRNLPSWTHNLQPGLNTDKDWWNRNQKVSVSNQEIDLNQATTVNSYSRASKWMLTKVGLRVLQDTSIEERLTILASLDLIITQFLDSIQA